MKAGKQILVKTKKERKKERKKEKDGRVRQKGNRY